MSVPAPLLPFAFVAAFAGLFLSLEKVAALEDAAVRQPLTLIAFAR